MDRYRYARVERRRPELIVLKRGVVFPAGEIPQQHSFEPLLGAVLQFRNGVVNVGLGDHAHTEEPLWRHGAVLLR